VFFAMEPLARAKERGAKIYAEFAGYGTAFLPPTGDASLFHASGEALDRAITGALAEADLAPADVDVVASSLSGLHAYDEAELASIARTVRADVAVAAPKALLGETLGAGGAMGMATAMAWLQGVPPSPIVRGAVSRPLRTALVTSLGFYGNASAVVLRAQP
jgi:3-oxoacyl-(acyl-carrier-protein) synthase